MASESYRMMRNRDITAEEQAKAVGIITKPLDPSLIKEREGGGKKMLRYIEGETVIKLLNEAFDYTWSFEVVSMDIIASQPKPMTKYNSVTKRSEPVMDENGVQKLEPQPPFMQVLGRLSVPGFGVKEQYGTKILLGGATEQEGAAKAATTDALKKCATLLGIGLELYEDVPAQQPRQENYSYQRNNYNSSYSSQAPKATPAPAPVVDGWSAKMDQVNELKSLKEKLYSSKLTQDPAKNEELNKFVSEFTGKPDATWELITPDNISSFNKFLNTKLN